MMLATTKVEDFERFLKVFSTKGAEKRKQHGSKGATVFRDPVASDRVWVIFDWDEQGFKNFLSDPEVPAIIKEAGHVGKSPPVSRCAEKARLDQEAVWAVLAPIGHRLRYSPTKAPPLHAGQQPSLVFRRRAD